MRLGILASHPIQYQAPIFRALSRRVDLTVFFAHRQTPEQQAAAGYGVAFDWDVDLTAGYRSVFLENIAANPGVAKFGGCDTPSVGAKIRQAGCDVVLLMGWNLKSYHQALWAARARGIPVLVRGDSQLTTPRDPLKRAIKSIVYPLLLAQFRGALYVGARSRDYYKRYGVPNHRLFFAPHCVDEDFFRSRATAEAGLELRRRLKIDVNHKVVLFVGRLVPFKRPGDIVEAIHLIGAEGGRIVLLVAGSGELAADLKQLADERGVRLRMMGFQNQKDLPSIYAASDVLVLPSDANETWGLVVNEALVSGTPAIVSDKVGCADDLGGDGVACRRYRVGDASGLASALCDVFRDPPSSAKINALARVHGLSTAVEGVVDAARWAANPPSQSLRTPNAG